MGPVRRWIEPGGQSVPEAVGFGELPPEQVIDVEAQRRSAEDLSGRVAIVTIMRTDIEKAQVSADHDESPVRRDSPDAVKLALQLNGDRTPLGPGNGDFAECETGEEFQRLHMVGPPARHEPSPASPGRCPAVAERLLNAAGQARAEACNAP
jgi:hypothetical protein